MEKIKFGILGCGVIADFHADAIAGIEDAELLYAADNKIENAEIFARRYGIKPLKSYEDMLEKVDAVCICTPSGFHAENAIAALKKGRHVVLEKPMAFTSEEADRIIETSDKSGALLTVISQRRFSEDVLKVKKLICENAFGKLAFCDLYMKYYRETEYYSKSPWKGTLKLDGGGALMNQGIHGIDLLQYMVGDAKVLKGRVKTISHDIETEDAAVAVLEFENGAIGVIEGSTCAYPGFERRIEIMGDKGYVKMKENIIEELMVNGELIISKGETNEVDSSANDPLAMTCDFHRKQIKNLIDAICGREPLLIDAREGKKAIKIIEAIYNSSKN